MNFKSDFQNVCTIFTELKFSVYLGNDNTSFVVGIIFGIDSMMVVFHQHQVHRAAIAAAAPIVSFGKKLKTSHPSF
jgi:hypothetical protein